MNLQDEQGHYLIAGKKITGFTPAEEIIAGKKTVVPFLNQKIATEHGVEFKKKRFYSEYALKDGQLITGQNPFSVRAVAKLLIQALTTNN
ncbi:hypothetical protein FC84_GL001447 [Lapidilactobacillus dextrinicus DSM 20335]|uniref:DJ-1/PfpI domain-containing protein n=1 Tax=Lapidilactobacillus dextrinicus DSM 20335 TaxID=1423738 RepID=A0A0R2BSG4_9LACO|nr:hypothetical protein FC84_GL001447 [Lapidilactobacillus dextrinicus DSM 20335]